MAQARGHWSLSAFASFVSAGLGVLAIAACTQTSRVADDLSTAKLADAKKAVAVMRIGAASPTCHHVAVLLGVRLGKAYRREQVVIVANVRSLIDVAVAEVELAAGEYHVIGYSCQQEKGQKTVTDKAGASLETGHLYGTSYTSFSVQSGEIVNVGYLHFGASHVGRSAFGRPLKLDISVSDWPLDELERFKQRRPTIYAQMVTRLMKITPAAGVASSDDCEQYKSLLADGKIAALPFVCAPADDKVAPVVIAKRK